jgi:hypothetical protein
VRKKIKRKSAFLHILKIGNDTVQLLPGPAGINEKALFLQRMCTYAAENPYCQYGKKLYY